ncbi:MAG: hypothetical protein V4640_00885 [Verrucomicrobiota bacterium]
MGITASNAAKDDGRLWGIALGLSLLLNVAVLGLAGFASIRTQVFRKPVPAALPTPSERVITIYPEIAADDVALEEMASKPRFARTSPDQIAPPPEKADRIGERDTQATSDRTPDATAPPLPSQAGIEPRHENDFETTESDYQEGQLESAPSPKSTAAAEPAPPTPAAQPSIPDRSALGEKAADPGTEEMATRPPPAEKLLEGPNPIDVAVPKEEEPRDAIKPTPPQRVKDGTPLAKPAELPKPPAAKPVSDPAFAGYQRKAAIVGSISRSGRSAMNVANTPLGRYQALISRAVEQEWQRNCVRHRDFITPGFLTVRFFVETSGKVRTVQFVGQMQTGEVQKGFTLNSIRDADIPAMPAALKKEYTKEPLELIFNFYF